jgi:hypothetical protein
MYFVTPIDGKFVVVYTLGQAKPIEVSSHDLDDEAQQVARNLNLLNGDTVTEDVPTDMQKLLSEI